MAAQQHPPTQLAGLCGLIGLVSAGAGQPEASSTPSSMTKRPLIAVLHDKHGDLEKLAEHGIFESDFGAVVDTADLAKEMACLHKVREIAGEQPASLRARLPDPHPYHKMTSLKAKIPIVGKSDDPESSKFLNQSGDANANSKLARLIWACALDVFFSNRLFHCAANDAFMTLITLINLLVLSAGDQASMTDKKDCPIILSIDFEGGRTPCGARVTTEAGFALLDPQLLIGSMDIVRDAMRYTKSFHYLFSGRTHVHPDAVVEAKMRINHDRSFTNRPRWTFAFGPNPGRKQKIPKGDSEQILSADTQIVEFDTLARHLRDLVDAAGSVLDGTAVGHPSLSIATKPYFDARLFNSKPQRNSKKTLCAEPWMDNLPHIANSGTWANVAPTSTLPCIVLPQTQTFIAGATATPNETTKSLVQNAPCNPDRPHIGKTTVPMAVEHQARVTQPAFDSKKTTRQEFRGSMIGFKSCRDVHFKNQPGAIDAITKKLNTSLSSSPDERQILEPIHMDDNSSIDHPRDTTRQRLAPHRRFCGQNSDLESPSVGTACAAIPGSKVLHQAPNSERVRSTFVPPHRRLFASQKSESEQFSKAGLHTRCAHKQVIGNEPLTSLECGSATNKFACESQKTSTKSPLRMAHTKRINTLPKLIDSNHRKEQVNNATKVAGCLPMAGP